MKELEYANFKTLRQMQFCVVTNSSMQDFKIEKNLVIKYISCEEYISSCIEHFFRDNLQESNMQEKYFMSIYAM